MYHQEPQKNLHAGIAIIGSAKQNPVLKYCIDHYLGAYEPQLLTTLQFAQVQDYLAVYTTISSLLNPLMKTALLTE